MYILLLDEDTRANIMASIRMFAKTCLNFVARGPSNMNVPYMRFRTPQHSQKYDTLLYNNNCDTNFTVVTLDLACLYQDHVISLSTVAYAQE